MSASTQLHASCVSLWGKGVLLIGTSGHGKSDLALRLIDSGATLVADDRVTVVRSGPSLIASPAERLRGLLEVRGIGILPLPYVENVTLALAVKLMEPNAVERMPEPSFFDCLGLQVPLLSLHAFDSSTCAKIRMYLQYSH